MADRKRPGKAAGQARGQARPRKKSGTLSWLKAQLARHPRPLWAVIVTDVLIFAVALNVFALFHHVLPRREQSLGVVSQRVALAPAATVDPAPTPEAAQAAPADPQASVEPLVTQAPQDPVGVFSNRFADKFTDGAVTADNTGYHSQNLSISFSRHEEPELVYYVADIYVRRIDSLRTSFAKDTYGRGRYERIRSMCERHKGIIAINGDYYGGRADGVVIRNGELYRNDERLKRDVCVIYWDGSMEIFTPETWDTNQAMEKGAYQAWNFGPSLLDAQGNARETFDSEVAGRNPRSAIGYYEPGHYCFVVVDGRQKASKGITLQGLSELMHGLGCTMAYNMDGGQSAEMVVNGQTVSKPYKGGRSTSDAILIVEE